MGCVGNACPFVCLSLVNITYVRIILILNADVLNTIESNRLNPSN